MAVLIGAVFAIGMAPQMARGQAGSAQMTVDANYPGGNIVVERMDGDTVHLSPDLRDTQGWWFYWNFRVRGAQGRTLTFRFSGNDPIGVRGPAVSTDKGRTWSWLGADAVEGASFKYAFPPDGDDVRFCFTVPYLEANLKEFLAGYANNANLRMDELCKTRQGRSVERIYAGRLDGYPRFRVLLTARHHACESMADFVLEGVLDTILADDEDGYWFRRNVEALAIPFMDKDGVEAGDQGKNRKPHDHNRDYIGPSIYPSVAALRTFVPNWSNGKLRAAFDLHCPYIRGEYNEVIYIPGHSDEHMWQEQRRFGRLLEEVQRGPLVYRVSDNLPFGKAWNTTGNFSAGRSCSRWAAGIEGVRLSAPFEIPYANAAGQPVTAESARAFGRSLARAMRAYLERIDEQETQAKVSPSVPVRVDGVFPQMTVMAHGFGSNSEAGIGALIPWADKLWAVGYVAHIHGQGIGLYEISEDMTMRRHPASVGLTGTFANRYVALAQRAGVHRALCDRYRWQRPYDRGIEELSTVRDVRASDRPREQGVLPGHGRGLLGGRCSQPRIEAAVRFDEGTEDHGRQAALQERLHGAASRRGGQQHVRPEGTSWSS